MRLVLLASLVVLSARTAEAKDTPAVTAARAALDAQVAAIKAHDAGAFAATFDDDGYAIFPTTLEAAGKAKIATAAKTWLGGVDGAVELVHPRFGAMGKTGSAWISAEIVVGKTRLRVTEMVSPLQTSDDTDAPAADHRVRAAHFSEAIDDKVSLTAVLPALPAIDGGQPGTQLMGSPDDMTGFVIGGDPAVTLIGSAPNELVTGKAAIAAKVKEFKRLGLKLVSYRILDDHASMNAASATVWHVEATYKVAGKPVTVPYRVLVITAGPPPAVSAPLALCAVHFSIAQR